MVKRFEITYANGETRVRREDEMSEWWRWMLGLLPVGRRFFYQEFKIVRIG